MKMTNCLIVDDEPLAREIIAAHIDKIPNWQVVHTCINADEAYEALLRYNIDVMFLDIQMPEVSGIEFLHSLQNPPHVIFTSAFSEYALDGFELNVVDYLLKPISFSRFYKAIEKANKAIVLGTKKSTIVGESPAYFFVKHDGKLLKVIFSEVLYIKAEQEYSQIFIENKKLLVSMHLKMLEGILPKNKFTRIHRSYIVQYELITAISGNRIQIGKEIQLPIGNKYKEDLLTKLKIK